MEENIEDIELIEQDNIEKSDQFIPYFNQIKDISLLSFEQEKALSIIIQERLAIIAAVIDDKERIELEKNDNILEKAISDLTIPNLRLVIKEAIDLYKKSNISVKDLIGYGNLGLIKAAYKYNAEKFKTKFSTYATYHIRNEMYIFLNGSHVVTIPFHILELRQKYNKMIDGNKELTDLAIIEELDITHKNLQRAKSSNVSSISMNAYVHNSGDSHENVTVGDLMADESDSPCEILEKKDKYNRLIESIKELDPLSQDIIFGQLVGANKSTLEELGLKHNVSGEYVRLVKEKALLKLKRIIKRKSI